MNSKTEKKTRHLGDLLQVAYRADIDHTFLMLKSSLILNSGALVSILVAISRSINDEFARATIVSVSNFLYGLIFAIIAMLFYTCGPTARAMVESGDKESAGSEVAENILLFISLISLFTSIVFFLVGTWSTVSTLKELVYIE